MKHKNSDNEPIFIPYDDNNMEHVMAGPDYGQIDSGSKETCWSEIDSQEYPDYVEEVASKIIKQSVIKFIA